MKAVGRVILSAIFVVLTGLAAAAAKFLPEFVFGFYSDWSRKWIGQIASVTTRLPFSLWEVLAVLALLWFFYTLVRMIRTKSGLLRWLSGVLLGLCAAVAIFVGMWGLNHFGPGVGENLGLSVRPYSRDELVSATQYYAAQAAVCSDQIARDESGLAVIADFQTLSDKAGGGYQPLAAQNRQFTGSLLPVKKTLFWPLFSRFGITGIFVCFTGESCVNPDTPSVWLPFTMCHELAHRQAVAAEDDANFCAYLACMSNEDAQFRYSGAFAAYVYCHNALSKIDANAASEIWYALPEGVRRDAEAANAHYEQYEGKVQDAATKINDAYLRAFSEESGVQSYGEVADLLIAWYQQAEKSS